MDAVTITGTDARSYLQGQISQDLAIVDRDGSAWSWILQPTGKVDALIHVCKVSDDSYRLDVDSGYGEALLARLLRFKIRVKAEAVLVAEGGGAAPHDTERERLEAGWPKMGSELTDATIPNETDIIAQTVSFTKGCYTGQELVARIDSRGNNVPKHLRKLRPTGGSLRVGDELLVGDKVVGRVTSSVGDLALGFVGRDIMPGGSVTSTAGLSVLVEAVPGASS